MPLLQRGLITWARFLSSAPCGKQCRRFSIRGIRQDELSSSWEHASVLFCRTIQGTLTGEDPIQCRPATCYIFLSGMSEQTQGRLQDSLQQPCSKGSSWPHRLQLRLLGMSWQIGGNYCTLAMPRHIARASLRRHTGLPSPQDRVESKTHSHVFWDVG